MLQGGKAYSAAAPSSVGPTSTWHPAMHRSPALESPPEDRNHRSPHYAAHPGPQSSAAALPGPHSEQPPLSPGIGRRRVQQSHDAQPEQSFRHAARERQRSAQGGAEPLHAHSSNASSRSAASAGPEPRHTYHTRGALDVLATAPEGTEWYAQAAAQPAGSPSQQQHLRSSHSGSAHGDPARHGQHRRRRRHHRESAEDPNQRLSTDNPTTPRPHRMASVVPLARTPSSPERQWVRGCMPFAL